MMKISIAKRIKRSMIGLTLTLCLVFTAMAMLLVYITEDKVFMNLLRNEQVQFEQLSQAERIDWQPTLKQMKFYSDDMELPIELQNIIGDEPGVFEYFNENQAMFVLRSKLDEATDYFISFDVSDLLAVRSSRYDLIILISIVSLSLIFISVLIAYRLAQKTLWPLKKLTTQLQDENAELPHGFAADFHGDEVGILAAQLELSIEQAQGAAQREFEFNRGVSHELRSPIQIALNALELLQLNGSKKNFNRQPVMGRLHRSIEQMKQITEAFLWMSSERIKNTGVCDMKLCMEKIQHSLVESYPQQTINLDCTSDVDPVINAPAEVFMVVVGSLIKNAIQHGSNQVVNCTYNAHSICIENAKDSAVNNETTGYGVGILIAQRMCERLGWQMSLNQNSKNTYRVDIDIQ